MPAGGARLRRIARVVLGFALLAGAAAATHVAAADRLPPRDLGRADFQLVDSAGRAHSIERFPPGSVLAIYFGYTTCLRACPIALDNIAAAMEGLGAHAASVRPILVAMDPEPAAVVGLDLYTQTFGPGFLGLTGSPEALRHAARSFKVQVERLQFSSDPTDYAMTHVSPIFVMRPGDPRPLSLDPASPPDAIEAAIRDALRTKPLS